MGRLVLRGSINISGGRYIYMHIGRGPARAGEALVKLDKATPDDLR